MTPPENSLYWYSLNASKRGITMDLKKKEGRELFKTLVKTANIVIESFKVRYIKRIGLGYNSLTKVNTPSKLGGHLWREFSHLRRSNSVCSA